MKTLQELWDENGKVPIKVKDKDWPENTWFMIMGQAPLGCKGFYGYDQGGRYEGHDKDDDDFTLLEIPKLKVSSSFFFEHKCVYQKVKCHNCKGIGLIRLYSPKEHEINCPRCRGEGYTIEKTNVNGKE